jgi:hypothetical protein
MMIKGFLEFISTAVALFLVLHTVSHVVTFPSLHPPGRYEYITQELDVFRLSNIMEYSRRTAVGTCILWPFIVLGAPKYK